MLKSLNLEKKTLRNVNYRKVIQTTDTMQLVLMNIQPNDNIPKEIHRKTTQFIRIESGSGYAILNGVKSTLSDGKAIVIPPGVEHEIVAGKNGMKLYTLYSPPEHEEGTIEKNKV